MHTVYKCYTIFNKFYSDFSLSYGLDILYPPRPPTPGHLNAIKFRFFVCKRAFLRTVQTGTGAHLPPIQRVTRAFSTGVKRPEREPNHFHLVLRRGCTFTHRTSSWPGIWARWRLSIVIRVGRHLCNSYTNSPLVLYLFNGIFFVYSDYSLTVSERHVQFTARVGSLGKISGQ